MTLQSDREMFTPHLMGETLSDDIDHEPLGTLVPAAFLLADYRREAMRLALKEAAQLAGELRPCVTCGATIACFRGAGKNARRAIYFTLETGEPHYKDCTPIALARLHQYAKHFVDMHETLKANGRLVECFHDDAEVARRHPSEAEIERLFQAADDDGA